MVWRMDQFSNLAKNFQTSHCPEFNRISLHPQHDQKRSVFSYIEKQLPGRAHEKVNMLAL